MRFRRGWFVREWFAPVLDFLRREDGPTAVEYAVMLALIIVVCIAAVSALGTSASNSFCNASLNNTLNTEP
jgi:pilus assembly protein Flp/PilA